VKWQPPQFLAKLQQHITKRVGDSDYAVTCSAKGKPKPTIEWFKDGKEIIDDGELYEIKTNPVEGPNGMVTVQSRLKFGGSKLYTCLYENEVNSANSSMQLRIEHEPIVLHQNKTVKSHMILKILPK
jgi:echinoid